MPNVLTVKLVVNSSLLSLGITAKYPRDGISKFEEPNIG